MPAETNRGSVLFELGASGGAVGGKERARVHHWKSKLVPRQNRVNFTNTFSMKKCAKLVWLVDPPRQRFLPNLDPPLTLAPLGPEVRKISYAAAAAAAACCRGFDGLRLGPPSNLGPPAIIELGTFGGREGP